MTMTENLILGVSAVAGFEVARRYIPDNIAFGKYNDLIAGAVIIGVGYYVGIKPIIAFGVGCAVEGVMTAIGI